MIRKKMLTNIKE